MQTSIIADTTYEENKTQEGRILMLLERNKLKNKLTTPMDIVKHCHVLQYNARIKGLRDKGYTIINIPMGTKQLIDGTSVRLTAFKLLESPTLSTLPGSSV